MVLVAVVDEDGEAHPEQDPDERPGQGFLHGDDVRVAVKDAQVEREHQRERKPTKASQIQIISGSEGNGGREWARTAGILAPSKSGRFMLAGNRPGGRTQEHAGERSAARGGYLSA